jgi:hypothetical protein
LLHLLKSTPSAEETTAGGPLGSRPPLIVR